MAQTAEITDSALRAPGSLVDKARDMVPILRANARRVDTQGRLTDDNVAALMSVGVYEMNKPRQFGGLETPLPEQIAVLAEIARGCGSTAWVASIGMFSGWLAAQFSLEAQADVFAIPDVRLCGSFTPSATAKRVDGGIVVNGSWPFNTGCLHAHWDILPARLTNDDGSVDVIVSLVPMSDVDIQMTWDVAGLAGTGSNTTVARDVFVPEYRTMPFSKVWGDGSSPVHADSPLFRIPAVSTMLSTLPPVPIGLARGALEFFAERLPGRPVTFTPYTDQSTVQLTHLQLAEAQTKADLAWLLTLRTAESLQTQAEAGHDVSIAERARIRSDGAYASRLAREAVEILNAASGASSISNDLPFRQVFRDIEAVALHAALNPNTSLEAYGRVLLGLDPQTTLL